MAPRGTCYGFEVSSEIPLSYLRPGTGIPLEIRTGPLPPTPGEVLYRWEGVPGGRVGATLRSIDDEHYYVEFDQRSSFEVRTRPYSIVVHSGHAPGSVTHEAIMWSTPAALAIIGRGDFSVHAASVDVEGSGVLLAAASSYGKTTLSGVFHALGYRLLADDMTCLALDPRPRVWPGPALLRIREDVGRQFDFDRTLDGVRSRKRTYLALDPGSRGTGDAVPLRAIVFLRISDGDLRLEPAEGREVVRDLFGLSFFLPTSEDRARSFRLAAGMAASVPAWNLYRPLTVESLPAVVESIVRTCLE